MQLRVLLVSVHMLRVDLRHSHPRKCSVTSDAEVIHFFSSYTIVEPFALTNIVRYSCKADIEVHAAIPMGHGTCHGYRGNVM